ncbi:hypothetical protein [Pseudomonas zhanjiangensis]|uniref:hypothetical protein n=1 Tax=Pseudomonas zhanjiangensis TaxID=3239015 RepID=UPI003F6995B3
MQQALRQLAQSRGATSVQCALVELAESMANPLRQYLDLPDGSWTAGIGCHALDPAQVRRLPLSLLAQRQCG